MTQPTHGEPPTPRPQGRPAPSEDPAIVDNPAESRFEIVIDGQLAELVYHRTLDRLMLMHTEVAEALGGRGVGSTLVTAAVDEAARHGLTMVPVCPYASSWLRKHPDVAARVAIDWPDD